MSSVFAFEKLPGLPRERIVDAIAPVLRAHGLAGVELIWRTDSQGRVLQVTLESAVGSGASLGGENAASENAAAADADGEHAVGDEGAGDEGAGAELGGVTLDMYSRVSRDLSTALDVAELIEGKYRLEVGSPGIDRRLYSLADYARFSGHSAKLKLASAVGGQHVLQGKLSGVDAEGRVLISADGVEQAIKFEEVRSGQLVVDWQEMGFSPRQRAGRRPTAQGRK